MRTKPLKSVDAGQFHFNFYYKEGSVKDTYLEITCDSGIFTLKIGGNTYTYPSNSDIRTYKEIALYDDYKRVKIVGIPDPITEPEELYRRQNGEVMDCVVVELTIHVVDPTKCDFNMNV